MSDSTEREIRFMVRGSRKQGQSRRRILATVQSAHGYTPTVWGIVMDEIERLRR
jgi:hypothetical protein